MAHPGVSPLAAVMIAATCALMLTGCPERVHDVSVFNDTVRPVRVLILDAFQTSPHAVRVMPGLSTTLSGAPCGWAYATASYPREPAFAAYSGQLCPDDVLVVGEGSLTKR